MASAATRREKNFVSEERQRTYLTPTGFFTEGHFTQNPVSLLQCREAIFGIFPLQVFQCQFDVEHPPRSRIE